MQFNRRLEEFFRRIPFEQFGDVSTVDSLHFLLQVELRQCEINDIWHQFFELALHSPLFVVFEDTLDIVPDFVLNGYISFPYARINHLIGLSWIVGCSWICIFSVKEVNLRDAF